MPLDEFPFDASICGVGLTDPEPIATRLAERFTYCNTYLDASPRLDVRVDASPFGALDFLVASEVFEHVEPPVTDAFQNAARLLKPSGVLLLTVPWVWDGDGGDVLPALHDWKLARVDGKWVIIDRLPDGQTIEFHNPTFDGSEGPSLGYTREHFPESHDWRLYEEGGGWKLFNRRRDGSSETFSNLVFHGGPGLALEMRVFTRADLERKLRDAGFDCVEFDSQEWREWGIVFPYPWSHPIVARFRRT
jgi:SAM-dependent methyltransferase